MNELSRQQQLLSSSLEWLAAQHSGLLSTYADHAQALDAVRNTTVDLLDTVVAVADNIATIQDARKSFLYDFGISRWLPYIISPIAALLLGSYGLEPSATRNLTLIALGEVVGFVVSHARWLTMPNVAFFAESMTNNSDVASF